MSIVDNKKAFHDYFIEERFEAGLVLEGEIGDGDSVHVSARDGSLSINGRLVEAA